MTARDTTADAPTDAQLLQRIAAVRPEIARQRAHLRNTWQNHTQAVERVEAQIEAVDLELKRRSAELDKLVEDIRSGGSDYDRFQRALGDSPRDRWLREAAESRESTVLSVNNWLVVLGPLRKWTVQPSVCKRFDEDLRRARQNFSEASRQVLGLGANRAGREALRQYCVRLNGLKEVRQLLAKELDQAKVARDKAVAEARATANGSLAESMSIAVQAGKMLPAPLQPWRNDTWRGWDEESPIEDIYALFIGSLVALSDADLGPNSDFGANAPTPCFVPLRQNLHFIYTNDARERASSLARSLLLRQMASAAPGELQFSFYDPVGLGQSVGELLDLAEYDPSLIGGKVWSSPQDLAARLTEQTAHIELVTQKYLRSTYDNIDDFNHAAGEVAEPYRTLVLFDVPAGLSAETTRQLSSIVLNGPRCGVHTLLLTNTSVEVPHGVNLNQVHEHVPPIDLESEVTFTQEERGYQLKLNLQSDAVPPEAEDLVRTIVDRVGRAAIGRTESTVTFDKVMRLFSTVAGRGIRTELPQSAADMQIDDEATWWTAQSTRGLYAPIGQRGARDAAILGFDSGNQSGALLVGRPGSGKSTLLHTYIGGLTTLYGPDELELYLIDFKEGVEFKSYANEGLPHARVVAIESDREFGVSVLQSLKDELTRRGDLFRSTGGQHAGIREFREASGEPLPRVLLVFDEFQVLFAKNDKLGLAAADLLETIIRQGRGFGVHVVLGSQSLSGLDALGAHVPQLLPTRILLPASELDGQRVLGDGNDGGQYLTAHGEGILNSAGGAVEANERFKGALLAEEDRIARLRLLRDKADRAGFSRRPTVFEGNASVPLESIEPSSFREQMASSGVAGVRMRVGEPMTVSGLADIELKREAAANVLAVVRDGENDGVAPSAGPAYGLLTAAVVSAAQSQAKIDVIDFMSVDDGLDAVLEPLLDCGRLTLRRRRAFAPLVEELAAEVDDRVEQDDAFRPARVALLFGIHRARELDAEIGSLDADAGLTDALERIMRDGPEFGVHVWLWADTVGGVSRRLTSRMMRECGWRVAGKMSPDDSRSLIGTEQAAEMRDRQLVLSNDDLGLEARAMSFSVPPRSWLEDVLGPADPADVAKGDPVDQTQEG